MAQNRLYTKAVLGLNLGQETGNPDRNFWPLP